MFWDRIKEWARPSRIGKKEMKKFGKFGMGSVICLPWISDCNQSHVYIGEQSMILANSRIQLFPNSRCVEPYIYIGNHCYLGYGLTLLAGADIRIGDEVLIASDVLITSLNHGMNPESDIPYMDQALTCSSVSIDDGTWLGEKVCILPGVHIGKKCVIGAGSVVTKSIPDYSIAAGNPARVIKQYNFQKHQWEKI